MSEKSLTRSFTTSLSNKSEQFLAAVAGNQFLKSCVPSVLARWSRRLRIQVWKHGGYRQLLESQTAKGRAVIHFLHLSKTGGTAVKGAFNWNFGNDRYYLWIAPHPVKLTDIPRGRSVAFILRDPVRRFVSAFNHRKAQGLPAYHDPWTRDESRAFSIFPDANSLGLALASSANRQRRQAVWAMNHIGLLDTKYTYWLESVEYLLSREDDLFFVGFQESLNVDFDRLCQLAGFSGISLPTDPSKSNCTGSMALKLSTAAEDALRMWYADDYELYDACRGIYLRKWKN